jgi:hypothetical protein
MASKFGRTRCNSAKWVGCEKPKATTNSIVGDTPTSGGQPNRPTPRSCIVLELATQYPLSHPLPLQSSAAPRSRLAQPGPAVLAGWVQPSRPAPPDPARLPAYTSTKGPAPPLYSLYLLYSSPIPLLTHHNATQPTHRLPISPPINSSIGSCLVSFPPSPFCWVLKFFLLSQVFSLGYGGACVVSDHESEGVLRA